MTVASSCWVRNGRQSSSTVTGRKRRFTTYRVLLTSRLGSQAAPSSLFPSAVPALSHFRTPPHLYVTTCLPPPSSTCLQLQVRVAVYGRGGCACGHNGRVSAGAMALGLHLSATHYPRALVRERWHVPVVKCCVDVSEER